MFLFQIHTGTYSEWTANAIGRNSKTVVEFLEKHHTDENISEEAAIRLAVSALLEIVESSSKNVEIGIMRREKGCILLDQEEVERLTKEISEEKEKEKAKTERKTD